MIIQTIYVRSYRDTFEFFVILKKNREFKFCIHNYNSFIFNSNIFSTKCKWNYRRQVTLDGCKKALQSKAKRSTILQGNSITAHVFALFLNNVKVGAFESAWERLWNYWITLKSKFHWQLPANGDGELTEVDLKLLAESRLRVWETTIKRSIGKG